MRIVSGKHKGKRIIAPKKLPVRPTTDMSKESLFNILNNLYYFDSISVIDLFSGTGNISYEFLSRGTTNITCVDINYACIKFIKKIFNELNFNNITTIQNDVYKFLETTTKTYDIIFADPPYNFETAKFLKIANIIFKSNLLNNQGIIIIEHSKQTDLSSHPNYRYNKRYGSNVFSFFKY